MSVKMELDALDAGAFLFADAGTGAADCAAVDWTLGFDLDETRFWDLGGIMKKCPGAPVR